MQSHERFSIDLPGDQSHQEGETPSDMSLATQNHKLSEKHVLHVFRAVCKFKGRI